MAILRPLDQFSDYRSCGLKLLEEASEACEELKKYEKVCALMTDDLLLPVAVAPKVANLRASALHELCDVLHTDVAAARSMTRARSSSNGARLTGRKMSRSVMVMQILTRCARCGALVEPRQMPTARRGETVWLWSAAATCTVDTSGAVAMDSVSTSVLCPDCMEQLKAWLAGGQTEDLSIAEDIIRDMYAALGAKPYRKQACVYLSERNPFMCARCMEDPKQCVDEMFKDIRWRCAEIGIDLKEEADAKRWQGQPEQAD